ncbi:MAG: hypothetical protein ACFFE5_08730 [Candidatus Thorarchaeota archaeon]
MSTLIIFIIIITELRFLWQNINELNVLNVAMKILASFMKNRTEIMCYTTVLVKLFQIIAEAGHSGLCKI